LSSLNEFSKLSRSQLLEAVIQASSENSTTAVFMHTIIAERVGLGATETKTLFILSSQGALTAGEIAQYTGLTTSSVTSLIDRLETKGFVRRVRDIHDRRRVIVERNEEQLWDLTQVFHSLQEKFMDFLETYSDEQLSIIADFVTQATRRSKEFIATLHQKGDA
jgi:DNA-binding MarR family transcriptional regulator